MNVQSAVFIRLATVGFCGHRNQNELILLSAQHCCAPVFLIAHKPGSCYLVCRLVEIDAALDGS